MKRLIVNADDYGRTEGICAGTLAAHRAGIVTSATAMVLEPAAADGIRRARAEAPALDLGLHVVLTGGGRPASPPETVRSLAPDGPFVRNADALPPRLDRDEALREIEAQIALFEKIAGRAPSHLDSHHHSALHPDVEPAFAEAARRRNLPVRASSAEARERLRRAGLRTPDAFLDGFYGAGATPENLRAILEALPDGTSELMCHPGYSDADLARGSTYAEERSRETEILRAPDLRALLARLGIELVPFSRL
ncbi:MAG TPA: ChbG/HpnK family deacetylase [Thermoanaerobaculia bacterium]